MVKECKNVFVCMSSALYTCMTVYGLIDSLGLFRLIFHNVHPSENTVLFSFCVHVLFLIMFKYHWCRYRSDQYPDTMQMVLGILDKIFVEFSTSLSCKLLDYQSNVLQSRLNQQISACDSTLSLLNESYLLPTQLNQIIVEYLYDKSVKKYSTENVTLEYFGLQCNITKLKTLSSRKWTFQMRHGIKMDCYTVKIIVTKTAIRLFYATRPLSLHSKAGCLQYDLSSNAILFTQMTLIVYLFKNSK